MKNSPIPHLLVSSVSLPNQLFTSNAHVQSLASVKQDVIFYRSCPFFKDLHANASHDPKLVALDGHFGLNTRIFGQYH